MFLKNIYNEMWKHQISFQGKSTLADLQKIDISTKEWRMSFILEVLKYAKYFNYEYFEESKTLPVETVIRQLLADANTYCENKAICWWKLKQIIQFFSFEMIKENDWVFNYKMIPEILDWVLKVSDFIVIVNEDEKTLKNSLYSFVWKSGKTYSWKWAVDLNKLNTDDALDIIEWLIPDINQERVINYAKENKEELKAKFKSDRIVYIWLIQMLVWFENKVSEYISEKLNEKLEDLKSELKTELPLETEETKKGSSVAPF